MSKCDPLSRYPDDSLINIETSIPLLHSAEILTVIESIEGAKNKLEQGEMSERLTGEARFLYCLWKMIDEEEVEIREIKEIVYLLNTLTQEQLYKNLTDIYGI